MVMNANLVFLLPVSKYNFFSGIRDKCKMTTHTFISIALSLIIIILLIIVFGE